jgi:hypothetical protein
MRTGRPPVHAGGPSYFEPAVPETHNAARPNMLVERR